MEHAQTKVHGVFVRRSSDRADIPLKQRAGANQNRSAGGHTGERSGGVHGGEGVKKQRAEARGGGEKVSVDQTREWHDVM